MYRIIILFSALLIILFLSTISAQENYLLSKNDIVSYIPTKHTAHWVIDKDSRIVSTINQKWIAANGTKNSEINIDYCEFSNNTDALKGTAYAATKTNAMPFTRGSFDDDVTADGS